jgi:hypothetical protein
MKAALIAPYSPPPTKSPLLTLSLSLSLSLKYLLFPIRVREEEEEEKSKRREESIPPTTQPPSLQVVRGPRRGPCIQ